MSDFRTAYGVLPTPIYVLQSIHTSFAQTLDTSDILQVAYLRALWIDKPNLKTVLIYELHL
jgi:hypothetical protein